MSRGEPSVSHIPILILISTWLLGYRVHTEKRRQTPDKQTYSKTTFFTRLITK